MKIPVQHILWAVAASAGLLTAATPVLAQSSPAAPGAADTTIDPNAGSTDTTTPGTSATDTPGNATGTELSPPSDPADTGISPDTTGTTSSPYNTTTGTDAGTGAGYAAGGQEDGFNEELLGLLGLIGLAGLRKRNTHRDRDYDNR